MLIIESAQKRDPKEMLYDCVAYVRENLSIVRATERFYGYLGDKSYMPVSAMIEPEAGKLLEETPRPLEHPLEIITVLDLGRDEPRLIYLRMENSKYTEDGQPLYAITLFDFRDLEARNNQTENNVIKYRRFLSWSGYYFFEYKVESDWFTVYKYVDERSIVVLSSTLEELLWERHKDDRTVRNLEQLERFEKYLRENTYSFEMEFADIIKSNKEIVCQVKGGRMFTNREFLVGVMIPEETPEETVYYLTPAARDAATGLLNKRAAAEYSLESIGRHDGRTRWIIMMDIDNFKDINDTYGHIFGDEVIQKTAATMKQTVGRRGIVGRFGGDEYYMLLEKVETREELKAMLKTITKALANEYDPKLHVTLSIGVSCYPKDGDSYETLLGKADKALYIAKEKGKNRHIIYDEDKHGTYEKKDQGMHAVTYSVSREKSRTAIAQFLTQLALNGVSHLAQEKVLDQLCEVLELDAIEIYTDGGRRLVGCSGSRAEKLDPDMPGMWNEDYLKLFGEDDVWVETHVAVLEVYHPELYPEMKKRDVGATVQCIGRRNGKPYAWIGFDVFGTARKWSSSELEVLTILGKHCCNLLCQAAEQSE